MRKIRKLQVSFGLVWGGLAFLVGVGATYYVIGSGILPQIPRWRTAAWFYLSANGLGISTQHISDSLFATGQINLLAEFPRFGYLEGLPIILSIFGAILVSDSIGYSKRPRHLVENSLSVVIGYFVTGVGVLYVSNAQPSFQAILLLLLAFGAMLFLGGTILSSLSGSLAFIGVASVWGVLLIGFIAFTGGLVVVFTLAPLVIYPTVGGLISASLLFVARRTNI